MKGPKKLAEKKDDPGKPQVKRRKRRQSKRTWIRKRKKDQDRQL